MAQEIKKQDPIEGVLLGIGNPLLDISAHVEHDFLVKYNLKGGNAILADKEHLPMYDEMIKNYEVEYIAGGAAQNTIRAAQWMLKSHPHACGYIGSVGDDENAKKLKEAAEKGGAKTHYYVTKEAPTGTCAVCVEKKERSLVANLGAANHYKKAHFDSAEIQAVVEKAKFYYSTGFFLTVSPETVVALGKHAVQHNKTLLFNLSAPFVIDFFFDALNSVLPYADIVFCNETEALTLGKKLNWGEDLLEIAQKLRNYEKVNHNKKRTVIFTQGAKSTIVVRADQVETFTPIPLDPSLLVDTNGAGDSFVGGFLSEFVQGSPLEKCIAAGHYCAWECIQRSGATYPENPNFVYKN